jgi:hypothetical protein
VSTVRKRWALLATELQFTQLDVVRKQGETWRTALGALTAVLTATFIIQGRNNVSALDQPYRSAVVGLLALALCLLLTATMMVSRSLAGPPDDEILLTGAILEDWTKREVRKVSRAIKQAPWLAVAGVISIAAAVAITWLAPAQNTAAPYVQVATRTETVCGQFIGVTQRQAVISTSVGATVLPLATVLSITPETSC